MSFKNGTMVITLCGVLLLALTVNFGLALKLGVGKPMVSDAGYFLEAAQSLATGEGYRVQASFWPGEPSMRRFPGWPFVVSLALRLTPGVNPDTVMRCVTLCVNAAAAVAIAWLTWWLFGGVLNHVPKRVRDASKWTRIQPTPYVAMADKLDTNGEGAPRRFASMGVETIGAGACHAKGVDEEPVTNNDSQLTPRSGLPAMAAAIAGLAYVFYPAALFNAYTGLSEPLFVLVVALGVILLVKGVGESKVHSLRSCILLDKSMVYGLLAFLLLGGATLIRGNFLLWLPIISGVLAVAWVARKVCRPRVSDLGSPTSVFGARISLVLSCIFLFLLPASLWTARNYKVCGNFPVLSTIGGQTFYGANNEVVANDIQWWGYWVFPDQIPAETPMRELAQTMSEYEVHDHYMKRGKQYLCEHWFAMPRLLMGKMIRAYVPMPWRPSWGSYAVAGYRWMLIVGVVIGLVAAWRRTPGAYRLILSAMVLTNMATVLVFYGSTRFAFSLEPFLLPFFGVGVVHVLMGRRVEPRSSLRPTVATADRMDTPPAPDEGGLAGN